MGRASIIHDLAAPAFVSGHDASRTGSRHRRKLSRVLHSAWVASFFAGALLLAAPAADAQRSFDRRSSDSVAFDSSGVSLDQAVEMAQRRYGARAVKAETVNQGGRRIHQIRLLSAEGKVWTVRVDAQTGDLR